LIFIGMFLRGAARASYQSVLVEQALGGARVGDVMIPNPVVVPGDIPVDRAVEEHFMRHGFGGFPVGHDRQIEGLLSLRQVTGCPPEERSRRTVRDIMRPASDRITIPVSAPVSDALRRMEEADTGRLLVTDGGRVIGLVTRTGITRFIQLRASLQGDEAA
jgi:predicted transcriptional regulator